MQTSQASSVLQIFVLNPFKEMPINWIVLDYSNMKIVLYACNLMTAAISVVTVSKENKIGPFCCFQQLYTKHN